MDRFWVNIPPVTKAWSGIMSITASLISLNHLKIISLVFIPEKAFGNESWRLFTSFCVSKGISLDLLMELFYIRTSSGRVEENFLTTIAILPDRIISKFDLFQLQLLHQFIERNKTIDYLYFLIQISISIIISASLIYYKLGITLFTLGHLLCRILMYIDSKNSPNVQVHFLGVLRFRRLYFPWIAALLNILPVRNVRDDFLNFIRFKDLNILTNTTIWFYIISIGLGHFWWNCRELLLSKIHYDQNYDRRNVKRIALKKYGVQKLDLTREFLMFLFVPPWYWFILSKIKNRI